MVAIQTYKGAVGIPRDFLNVYARMTKTTWHNYHHTPGFSAFWKHYIKQHHGLVIDSIEGLNWGKKISLCIIGVENGFDIPWDFLEVVQRIERVVLVDLDRECMERRRKTLPLGLRNKVEIVQADASLGVGEAINEVVNGGTFSDARKAASGFIKRCSASKYLLPFSNMEFDLVLSTQVMNQLLVQPLEFIKQIYGYPGMHLGLVENPAKIKDKEQELQVGHIIELFRLSKTGGRVLISHIPSERRVSLAPLPGYKNRVAVNEQNLWATKRVHHSKSLSELLAEVRKSIKMQTSREKRWGWLQIPPYYSSGKGTFLTVEGMILETI